MKHSEQTRWPIGCDEQIITVRKSYVYNQMGLSVVILLLHAKSAAYIKFSEETRESNIYPNQIEYTLEATVTFKEDQK